MKDKQMKKLTLLAITTMSLFSALNAMDNNFIVLDMDARLDAETVEVEIVPRLNTPDQTENSSLYVEIDEIGSIEIKHPESKIHLQNNANDRINAPSMKSTSQDIQVILGYDFLLNHEDN